MSTNGKVMLALLIGAAAGAAAALLFAPESGADTRRKISEGVSDLGKKIMGRGEEMADEAGDMYDNARSTVRSKVTRNV